MNYCAMVAYIFYVGPDRFVVRDVFLSVFGGSIVTIKMGMEHTFSSRRFDLFGPSSIVVCVLLVEYKVVD